MTNIHTNMKCMRIKVDITDRTSHNHEFCSLWNCDEKVWRLPENPFSCGELVEDVNPVIIIYTYPSCGTAALWVSCNEWCSKVFNGLQENKGRLMRRRRQEVKGWIPSIYWSVWRRETGTGGVKRSSHGWMDGWMKRWMVWQHGQKLNETLTSVPKPV